MPDRHVSLADEAAIQFLTDLLTDRARGAELPLGAYLARFPGHEARIAQEWVTIVAQAAADRASAANAPADAGLGGYRIQRELGRGGQGVVYLARDDGLGRDVALKVLAATPFSHAAELRFRREVEAIGRLDHPALCAVHGAGVDEERRWIAMKLVDGPSLEHRLAAQRSAGLPPPSTRMAIDAAVRLIERLARGLACAHAAGIVHRDIKPANVLIGPEEQPVLVDFGIARDVATATLTAPGSILGTVSYLAPELLSGAVADARSDLWSLGACLFELLTLRRPYPGATPEAELRARATDEVPDVRSVHAGVPKDLAIAVAAATAREPNRRYAKVADFADDLARFLRREPIAARPSGPMLRLRRWSQRNRPLALALASLFVVLLAALGVTLHLLAETTDALTDVTRLSDQRLCNELAGRAATLWPLREDRLRGKDGIDAWLADVDALLAHRTLHERARLRLVNAIDTASAPWHRELLDHLLADLTALAAQRARVAANREFAASVRKRTIDDLASAWHTVTTGIAAAPRYDGLRLAPQLGLVPLGPDPQSGLFEFAVLQSGEVPVRDETTGALRHTEATGIVLVLVPGGAAVTGAARSGDGTIDPDADDGEGPCSTVVLQPYFLAKFEMTQGQWRRHTGGNPSNYTPESTMSPTPTERNPVEQVSWTTADEVMHQLGLELPTEVQWENAYRAGMSTPFPYGFDRTSLQGHENLADADARAANKGVEWHFEDWLRDGFLVHAPVGSFAPNAMGFHDMGGNLKEWCRDSWEDLSETPPRASDGFRFGPHSKYRIIRGGSFTSPATCARAAFRGGYPSSLVTTEVGVRPARAVDP